MKNKNLEELTRGGLLAKNTIYTLLGQGAPMFIALFTIPILIKYLGIERFGLLSLCWVVLGYFSLFDLGIGRVVIKLVAEKLGSDDTEGLSTIVWTSLLLLLIISFIGALLVVGAAPLLVDKVFKIGPELKPEALKSFYLLAIGIPIVTLTAGVRGVLEAKQRFDITNLIQIFLGIFNFVGPLLVLPFSTNVFWVILMLLVGRFVVCLVHIFAAIKVMPEIKASMNLNKQVFKRVVRFGSFITISNILSPIMVYLDRFLVGSLVSITAIAYYSTSYEVISRLWLIPGAIVQVLFPAISACIVNDRARAIRLYESGMKFILMGLGPVILLFVAFAHEGFQLWLGDDFAKNSTMILQVLAFGVLFNGLARMPFTLIQSAEKAEWTALVHVFEFPIFVFILWFMTTEFGVVGAAFATMWRMGFDMFLLMYLGRKILPETSKISLQSVSVVLVILLSSSLLWVFKALWFKFVFVIVMSALLFSFFWFIMLDQAEKEMVLRILRRGRAFAKHNGNAQE